MRQRQYLRVASSMQIWHLEGRSARIVTNEHVWERELSNELNDWGMHDSDVERSICLHIIRNS